MRPSGNEYKRCRPLLGTFVEIALWGAPTKELSLPAELAYRSIEAVRAEMSFHDPESELSRLNRTPVGRWLRISSSFLEVLAISLDLQQRSLGRFNVAIADPLVQWRLLPGPKGQSRASVWSHLGTPGFELGDGKARRLFPVRIDLGGIAKGYAVDCAVQALREQNPSLSGYVNAGGDLRVFGRRSQQVWIRSGSQVQPMLRPVCLKNRSIATSSVISKLSPYVDIRKRKPLGRRKTATVSADRCVIADALTKIALLVPGPEAGKIMAHFGAEMRLLA